MGNFMIKKTYFFLIKKFKIQIGFKSYIFNFYNIEKELFYRIYIDRTQVSNDLLHKNFLRKLSEHFRTFSILIKIEKFKQKIEHFRGQRTKAYVIIIHYNIKPS